MTTVTKSLKNHSTAVTVPQYYTSVHPFWRNLFEAAAALGFVLVGTLIVHLVMSWWSALAALH
jgi:hypothetical protein